MVAVLKLLFAFINVVLFVQIEVIIKMFTKIFTDFHLQIKTEIYKIYLTT